MNILIIISFIFFSCQVKSPNLIEDPGFGQCPKANGCECKSSDTCPENSECKQLYRGKYCVPNVGSLVPQFIGFDQFGNQFNLYDLAKKGKPIMIEICSSSSKACQDFSAWKSHQSDESKKRRWWKNKFLKVRDLIDNNDIFWITIIHIDENKNPASKLTIKNWHNRYPHKNITILADPKSKMKTWVRPTGLPCVVLVDENMILQAHTLRGIEPAIEELYNSLDIDY